MIDKINRIDEPGEDGNIDETDEIFNTGEIRKLDKWVNFITKISNKILQEPMTIWKLYENINESKTKTTTKGKTWMNATKAITKYTRKTV